MSLEDPFLIVQNEVFDALHKLRNNFTRWTEIQSNPNELSREDYQSCFIELKNALKSIQWDLDELDESLENSERTLSLDSNELQKRKTFIEQTRAEISSMNEQITKGNAKFKKPDFSSINFGSSQSSSSQLQPHQLQTGTKYFRLINEPDVGVPQNQPTSMNSMTKSFDDDDEHKSPYVTNHSITMDETEHNVHVINGGHNNKLEYLQQYWSAIPVRQRLIAGFSTTATLLVLLIIWLL